MTRVTPSPELPRASRRPAGIGLAICCALGLCAPPEAPAQSTLLDTPPPQVTAEAEPWYLGGAPVTFAGHMYYPAGPRVHFMPSEMVRSGDFMGVPLYARTTIEPYSIVFVPVGGGMMQPYERRRDGDLAGTVGSSAPSFPVAAAGGTLRSGPAPIAQAPAPPMLGFPSAPPEAAAPPQPAGGAGTPAAAPQPVGASGTPAAGQAVGTTGMTSAAPARGAARGARPSRPPRFVRRAGAANAIFITYAGERWFSSGEPIAYDAAGFQRSGEKDGFGVFTRRDGPGDTIYLPLVKDSTALLAPYSRRPR